MTATLTADTRPTPSTDVPTLGAAVRAEWTKLRTSRAPRRNLVLGTVLGIASANLLSLLVASTFDEWSAQDRADFNPVFYPMSGGILMSIFFVAASVGCVTSEYSSGMIRLSLTAVPRRGRFLMAKVVVVTAVVWVASIVALLGMLIPSQAIFAAHDMDSAGFGDADFVRAFVMLVATGPLWPVLSIAAAFLLRKSAGAVTSILALIFVPSMFGGLLPGWWQRNIVSLLPGPAGDSLALGHLDDSAMFLATLPAAVVVLAWIVGPLAVTRWVLDRRDA